MKNTCPTCNKKHAKNLIGGFCHEKCKQNYRFTWLGYIVLNYKKMKPEQMAVYIGIPRSTFWGWIFNFNKAIPKEMYIRFPKGKEPIGDGKTAPQRYEEKKRAERNVLGITKSGKPKSFNPQSMRKAPKRDDKLPDRVIDASKLKSVKINTATTVLVNIDVPDDVAIANYLKRRAESQNFHCYNKSA